MISSDAGLDIIVASKGVILGETQRDPGPRARNEPGSRRSPG